MDIVQKGGAMFPEAIDELTGQGGGELEELIRIEERSHCGVQTDREPLKWESGTQRQHCNICLFSQHHHARCSNLAAAKLRSDSQHRSCRAPLHDDTKRLS